MSDDYPHRALLLFPDQIIAPFESTEIDLLDATTALRETFAKFFLNDT